MGSADPMYRVVSAGPTYHVDSADPHPRYRAGVCGSYVRLMETILVHSEFLENFRFSATFSENKTNYNEICKQL